MKASPISTLAVSQAMRNSLLRMQFDLIGAQKEVSTGRVADMGLALGSRTGQAVSFKRDMERLNGIIDSNQLVQARLKATQDAMAQMNTVAQNFLQTLTASASGDAPKAVTQTDAKGMIDSLTSILNSSLNGEHLFAGINTDVKPINDFNDPASPNKAAFDAAFLAHFGFAQSAPAAATITSAQMETFMTTIVEPTFLGSGWETSWSNASDSGIVSRIALTETAQTSVSGNEVAIRKLMVAAASVSDLFSADLSQNARNAVITSAINLVGQAVADLGNLMAETGVVQNRMTRASERLTMQIDLFERNIIDMESVDPYEASTRVTSLLTQIETSYALTARIQQLSLVRFLT
jgi:flagellar hook-associated protein 3 FlgL